MLTRKRDIVIIKVARKQQATSPNGLQMTVKKMKPTIADIIAKYQ